MRVKRQGEAEVRGAARFCAIVLAAGAGRRFGGGKLTAPWRGGVLLDGALASAFAAPAEEVVVVSGADSAAPAAARAFAARVGRTERLRVVEARDWSEGVAASLRAGVGAVPAGRSGAFVFLGDMPLTPPDLAGRLAEAFTGDIAAAAPQTASGPGHPVLIRAELFGEVMALTGDRGARALLEGLGRRLARVAVDDPGATFDVDTPQALGA